MTKIVTTIGPASIGKNLKFVVENSDILRLNLSHNILSWHKKIIDQIRNIDKNKLILLDIPGIKPRTLNKNDIYIKKGQTVKFAYKNLNKSDDIIQISNPLPINLKKNKFFYLSDGLIKLKFLKIQNNILYGISTQDFLLKSKKV